MPIVLKPAVRLVFDTNKPISGWLWHGIPGRLIEAAQARSISLYAHPAARPPRARQAHSVASPDTRRTERQA